MLYKRYVNGYAFMYDSNKGLVYRKMKGTGKWRLTGRKIDAWGYYNIVFKRQQMLLHRFIYLIVTGDWPIGQVDHINGIKEDNRWENLRDVTASINAMNQHRKPPTGESHITRTGAGFRVRFGGRTHIGYYDTLQEAIEARDSYLDSLV